MLNTPHMRRFGLVFIAILISAVHAMPTPLIMLRSGNDNMAHTVTPLARRKEKQPEMRITLFDSDWNENKDELPLLKKGDKTAITKVIQGIKGIDARYTSINARYMNRDLAGDKPLVDKMFIFVIEELNAPEDGICGGALPCVGYRALAGNENSHTRTSIYQLKPGETGIETGINLHKLTTEETEGAHHTTDSTGTMTKFKEAFDSLLEKKLKDPKGTLAWWEKLRKVIQLELEKEWRERKTAADKKKSDTRKEKLKNNPDLAKAEVERAAKRKKELAATRGADAVAGKVAEIQITAAEKAAAEKAAAEALSCLHRSH